MRERIERERELKASELVYLNSSAIRANLTSVQGDSVMSSSFDFFLLNAHKKILYGIQKRILHR